MWVSNGRLSLSVREERHSQSLWQESKIVTNGKAFSKYEDFNSIAHDKGATETGETSPFQTNAAGT